MLSNLRIVLSLRWDCGIFIRCLNRLWYKLHVTSFMLQVACYKLYVTNCMLQIVCYKLRVTSCMQHVLCFIDLDGSVGSNADLKPKGLIFESRIRQDFFRWNLSFSGSGTCNRKGLCLYPEAPGMAWKNVRESPTFSETSAFQISYRMRKVKTTKYI
jgi:hypothetical protein